MVQKPVIRFFTDQNVPDSVGEVIVAAGHELTRLRDVMDTETADPIIAVACANTGHVLVSHDNDFRQITRRLGITHRQYRTSLHRIQLSCPEPDSAQRLTDALGLIEFEWLQITPERPMVIDITAATIRTWR